VPLERVPGPRDRVGQGRSVLRRPGEPELELWLDERNGRGIGRELDRAELRDGVRDRQVREVDRHDVDRVRHELARELAEVRPLEVDDPLVEAQRAEQLPVPRIDGIDTLRARVEQHTREPARGGADVEGYAPIDVQRERSESCAQLRFATQDDVEANDDRYARADERRRIRAHDPIDRDLARANASLGIVEVWMRPRELVDERAQARPGLAQRCLLSVAWSRAR
jgi:hypothetical protein